MRGAWRAEEPLPGAPTVQMERPVQEGRNVHRVGTQADLLGVLSVEPTDHVSAYP